MYSTDNILNTLSGEPDAPSDAPQTASANTSESTSSSAADARPSHASEQGVADGRAAQDRPAGAASLNGEGAAGGAKTTPVRTGTHGPRPGHFLSHMDPTVRDRLVTMLTEQTAEMCSTLVRALRENASPLYTSVSEEELCSSIGVLYRGYIDFIRTGDPTRLGDLSAAVVRTRLAQGFELADMVDGLGAWREAFLPKVVAAFASEPEYLVQAVDSLIRAEELASVRMAEAFQEIAAEQLQAAHEETLRAEHEKVVFGREMARVATHDKLILCDAADIPAQEGVEEMILQIPRQVRDARHAAQAAADALGWNDERSYSLQLCIGEAGTNAIRHAGGATFQVWTEEDAITFRLADSGPGIDFCRIPTALQSGYSTGSSLGMGFTLMLEVADCIRLATDPNGTTLQITLHLKSQNKPPDLLSV